MGDLVRMAEERVANGALGSPISLHHLIGLPRAARWLPVIGKAGYGLTTNPP